MLLSLCNDFNVGLILITHDLGVVSEVTQRIMVMYAGRIIEQGPTHEVINKPRHPYTRGLISALPERTQPGQPLNQIPGVMPSLQTIPAGCAFHDRCEYARERCSTDMPELHENSTGLVACHYPLG